MKRVLVPGVLVILASVIGLVLPAVPLPPEYETAFAQPEWVQSPSLRADFISGHTFMDFYSRETFERYLDSTLDSMCASGAEWAIYDNYWTYNSLEPPQLVRFGPKPYMSFRDATEDEIAAMVEGAHSRGMKLALMIELNYDGIIGDWKGFEYSQSVWHESAAFLESRCAELIRTLPSTASDYWDLWFQAFEAVVVHHARIAEAHGADMLVIGKQIAGAVCPGNEARWRSLIEEARNHYRGPIGYAALHMPGIAQAEAFPCDALDYLIIYYYLQVSGAANPSIAELRQAFDQYNETTFEPVAQRCDVPIIFLTPFQSRDHGALQHWFEPCKPAPDVGRDLMVQAKMYEAFLQSIADEVWAAGLWTWGYWWRDDFTTHYSPGDSSFDKSSTVRGKPASYILTKWWGGEPLCQFATSGWWGSELQCQPGISGTIALEYGALPYSEFTASLSLQVESIGGIQPESTVPVELWSSNSVNNGVHATTDLSPALGSPVTYAYTVDGNSAHPALLYEEPIDLSAYEGLLVVASADHEVGLQLVLGTCADEIPPDEDSPCGEGASRFPILLHLTEELQAFILPFSEFEVHPWILQQHPGASPVPQFHGVFDMVFRPNDESGTLMIHEVAAIRKL